MSSYFCLRKQPAANTAQVSTETVVFNAKLPRPARIDLPTNSRPEVAKLLQEKDGSKLTRKIRKSFISRIYEHFSRFALLIPLIQCIRLGKKAIIKDV